MNRELYEEVEANRMRRKLRREREAMLKAQRKEAAKEIACEAVRYFVMGIGLYVFLFFLMLWASI